MPPKKQKATTFGSEHKEALQRGFKEFGWDPYETEGRNIKRIIESTPELLVILKPLFGTSDGGTKANNNSLYGHYKTQASEYILLCARKGIRRRGLNPKNATANSQSDSSHTTTGAFLENQTKEGGRKRGYTGEEAEEDEDMDRKQRASSAKPKSPFVPKAGDETDGDDPPSDELEFLLRRMEGLKIDGGESGFNFNCLFPHIWWTFTHNSQRFLKVDFLVWGNIERDIYPEISKDGRTLFLHNRIVERFIDMRRIHKIYEDVLTGDMDNCEASMLQEGKKLSNIIREHFNMRPIMPVLAMELPYEVQPQFFDGYRPDSKGYSLKGYPHDENVNRKIYIYHVNLREANKQREKVETEYEDVQF